MNEAAIVKKLISQIDKGEVVKEKPRFLFVVVVDFF
jgi:hypothetical protein